MKDMFALEFLDGLSLEDAIQTYGAHLQLFPLKFLRLDHLNLFALHPFVHIVQSWQHLVQQ